MTPRADAAKAVVARGGARRILVVDDEPDSVDLLCAILEAHAYTAVAAHSGAAALRSVAERIPDLILLDVMMPEMSGFDVLAHLRRDPRTARIPTILITAKRQDDDVILGYRLGADYYITKPCTASQLLYGLDLVWSARKRPPAAARAAAGSPPRRILGG